MRVLLVEDDEFKAADILRTIEEMGMSIDHHRAASVTSALRSILSFTYDVIILDMSLPTFDLSGPGGGGSPQGQGGIEVLRLARKLDTSPTFIIATQYPDIEIDGRETPLAAAASKLQESFRLKVTACILYQFDGVEWKEALKTNIGRIQAYINGV